MPSVRLWPRPQRWPKTIAPSQPFLTGPSLVFPVKTHVACDRSLKVLHKERSAFSLSNGTEEPPFIQGVISHLLSRLEDTTRTFKRVLLLGNYRMLPFAFWPGSLVAAMPHSTSLSRDASSTQGRDRRGTLRRSESDWTAKSRGVTNDRRHLHFQRTDCKDLTSAGITVKTLEGDDEGLPLIPESVDRK